MEDDNLQDQIRLHSAGATVRHQSAFESLPSYRNSTELDKEFIDKWVIPFYMKIGHYSDSEWIDNIKRISPDITEEVTLKLLGDFNWRTRLVGAYLSAVKNYQNQIDIIGTHFLKSEVCCVGHIYALVLAFYNNEKSNQYLNSYLEYYLKKPELYFDQESALESIAYLDELNKTDHFSKYQKDLIFLNSERGNIQRENAEKLVKIITKEQGINVAEGYLNEILSKDFNIEKITTDYIKKQIFILSDLKEYCNAK